MKNSLSRFLLGLTVWLAVWVTAAHADDEPLIEIKPGIQVSAQAVRQMAEVDKTARKEDCGCLKGFLDQNGLEAFGDLYAEGVTLSRVNTLAFYGQLRGGVKTQDGRWEGYGVIRSAGDTRTGTDGTQDIYNDNYLFFGVGLDHLGLIPGVRLISQVGYSVDTKDQVRREGFDYRVGGDAYYEIPFPKTALTEEIYADALYIGRYRNALSNVQLRTYYKMGEGEIDDKNTFDYGPVVQLTGNADSEGIDYNRFAELSLGARMTVRGPINISIRPQYVFGTRWQQPTNLPRYEDFRILATAYCSF